MTTAARLITTIRLIERERASLAKASAQSGQPGQSPRRMQAAAESARTCAIELRRLRHEAHCLAVELGIADRRPGAAYSDTTAPAGFGRDTLVERRAPDDERQRVAAILAAHNSWRRGEGEEDGDLCRPPSPMPCTPQELGAAIDRAVELLGGARADKEAGNG